MSTQENKKRKYFPIGIIVEYEHVKLKVEATKCNTPMCSGCYFSDAYRRKNKLKRFNCYMHGFDCLAFTRIDKKHVVFKKIES